MRTLLALLAAVTLAGCEPCQRQRAALAEAQESLRHAQESAALAPPEKQLEQLAWVDRATRQVDDARRQLEVCRADAPR